MPIRLVAGCDGFVVVPSTGCGTGLGLQTCKVPASTRVALPHTPGKTGG